MEAGCYQTVTISPPPIVGGFVRRNMDPFGLMFEADSTHDATNLVIDMIDRSIGVLKSPPPKPAGKGVEPTLLEKDPVLPGYVFIAMPMAGEELAYEDVHDAIKAAAKECSLNAERVDEVQSNERITDRLLESIRKAEFVVADLTDARPNVFYEAGYAYGIGKTPIYIARAGTKIEFDLKDYPIIFFGNLRQLREGLVRRFRGLSS